MNNQSFKWTTQLHDRFLGAVSLLGGATKATPESVERLMGISGLSLRLLNTQLQKHRLAMKRASKVSIDATRVEKEEEEEEDCEEEEEVQRHLQLRIEAQRNYLQAVLERAREMLENDCRSSDCGSRLTCEDEETQSIEGE